MELNTLEKNIQDGLEALNFKVCKITETEVKTPDFCVTIDSETYLIEVKEKLDNPSTKKEMLSYLEDGELFETSLSLESTGSIEKILSIANGQIKEAINDESYFLITWIHCSGMHDKAIEEQIISTIYGSKYLWDNSEKGITARCYYFGHSRFFRYKNTLDAVIITNKDNMMQLCLNNYSPRYEKIKESKLAQVFIEGLLDPFVLDAEGKGFLADTDIDRNDERKILDYLETKYNSDNLIVFPMDYHSVTALVPRS